MTALFAIYDTMQFLRPDVATICVGQAASAAAVLLAAGAPGKRSALPNARVLIHQPHGGAQGQSTDIELAVAEMVEMRRRMVAILAGRPARPRSGSSPTSTATTSSAAPTRSPTASSTT